MNVRGFKEIIGSKSNNGIKNESLEIENEKAKIFPLGIMVVMHFSKFEEYAMI